MKNYFLALFFLFISGYCSYAQQMNFSVTAGLNQSNIQQNLFSQPFTKGFNAGIVANYPLSKKWQLHGGLMYSEKGVTFHSDVLNPDLTIFRYKSEFNRSYLTLPMYVSYQKPLTEKLTLYPMLGIFQGILLYKELKENTGDTELYRRPGSGNIPVYDAGLLLGAGLSYSVNDYLKLGIEYKLEPSFTSLSGPLFSFKRYSPRNLNAALNFSLTFSPFAK